MAENQPKRCRRGDAKQPLSDVLIMVMGTAICGLTELADIMAYFNRKIGHYNEQFKISKYPSKSTLSRILNIADGDAVGKVIMQVMYEKCR